MTAILVKAFNGLKPISHPVLLDNADAQIALNVLLTSGAIRPLNAVTVLKALKKSAPLTIYRFDPDNNAVEANYWLEFAKDVDLMRSPVAQDQWQRLYWTDPPNQPRYAPASMVIAPAGDGSLPGASYLLGIPKPSTAPTVTGSTAVVVTDTVSRSYLLTFWNATTSKESTPGKPFTASAVDGQEVKLTNLTTDNRGDTGVTDKRLYRQIPDPSPATTKAYHLIATIPLATAEYKDTTTDAAALLLPLLPAGIANAPPSPQYAPLLTAVPPSATSTSAAVARKYTYTVNGYTDAGSPPTLRNQSAPSAPVSIMADNTQTVTISGLNNAIGGQYFSIYREDPTDANTALLVKQIPTSQTSYTDVLSVQARGGPVGAWDGAPSSAPAAATLAVNASTVTAAVKRIYMVTFVDGSSHESGKSPASEVALVIDGVTVVSLYHSEPLPAGVTKKRLYRQTISTSGGLLVTDDANWKLVAENSSSATNAVDTFADSALPGTGLAPSLQGIPPTPIGGGNASSTIPTAATPESRVYCYTLVSAYDEEGPPSESSDVVSVDPAKNVTLDVPLPPSGNYNITKKRLYRSATGTARTKFMFVKEDAASVTTFVDDVKTEDLSEVLETEGWIPPPVGLQGLRMMANGAAVGFVGKSLFFSEPNQPHAWPHEYPIDEIIVGIGVFGQSVAVLTTGYPYLFQGIDPVAMASTKMELPQACATKRSIVETGDGVLYASPDGLTMLGQGATLVTQPIMSRAQWQAYSPASMECRIHNGRIITSYFAAGVRGILMFDLSGSGAAFTTADINAATAITAGHYSPKTDILYLAQGTNIVRWDSGSALRFFWKSKVFRQPMHDNFGFAQVLAPSYANPPILNIWADGANKLTHVVTSADEFRLPSGFKARDWEFQIEGSVEITEIFITSSAAELQAA